MFHATQFAELELKHGLEVLVTLEGWIIRESDLAIGGEKLVDE